MAWLYTRHHDGAFIVRVEDTDRERYVEGAEARMLEALSWYGITHDEGPDVGGNFGPYRQSERLSLYQEHAQKLIDQGSAYYCFCSPEVLDEMRKQQQLRGEPTRYDRRCLAITPEEAFARSKNERHVIRMKFPAEGVTTFHDDIRGEVTFQNALIDDQVLLKSDGWPTYHLAVVVDDHLMQITHVIRGEDWLPSTPKHLVLYKLFGWDTPRFAHLPLILGADRSKLSKRHGSVEAMKFHDDGYLPEAMINFLALLGWSPKSDQEIFTLNELVERFDLDGFNKSGAIFDLQKLQWFNGQYIKKMSPDTLAQRLIPYLEKDNYIAKEGTGYVAASGIRVSHEYLVAVAASLQERLRVLSDVSKEGSYFFERPLYEPNLLVWKKSTPEITLLRLRRLIEVFTEFPDELLAAHTIEQRLMLLIETEHLDNGDTLWPLRVALSGRKESPGPFALASILGKSEVLERLNRACAIMQK